MDQRSQVADLYGRVRRFLISEEAFAKRISVGLSGGVDSMVLLDCIGRLRHEFPIELKAVHINHGLSPNADRWAEFCTAQAGTREIPIQISRVQVCRGAGTSLEAEARKARFAIYARLDTDLLALAHHLDDQAETLLLQLLRGAGPKGLSSMAASTALGPQIDLVRPLLDVGRAQIMAYAREAGLQWVEDESNPDPRFDRNFLRTRVIPILETRFPGYRNNLSRSAKNMADLDEVAQAMARYDLSGIANPRGISVTGLRALSPARALNALRSAVERHDADMPPRGRLMELLRQVTTSKNAANVQVNLGALIGRVYRGELRFTMPDQDPGYWRMPWTAQDRTQLPHQLGWIQMRRETGRGLRLDVLGRSLEIRNRRGGEHLRLHPRQACKTLTNLFQVAGIPPWERARMPLLVSGEEVLWVPRLGYASDYQAAPGAHSFELTWCNRDAEPQNP